MTRSPALRDHVATGLLDTAAGVLAERGTETSMSDIAEAAGVSRATLYRYFPNREALLGALKDAAMADLSGRLHDARLDAAPAAGGDRPPHPRAARGDEQVPGSRVVRRLPRRKPRQSGPSSPPSTPSSSVAPGKAPSAPHLPARTLSELYVSLLEGVIRRTLDGRLGAEEASAAITTVFLAV